MEIVSAGLVGSLPNDLVIEPSAFNFTIGTSKMGGYDANFICFGLAHVILNNAVYPFVLCKMADEKLKYYAQHSL
ncbi:MAG: hypothetical protein AAFX53_10280 [Bacteroidota bacterium]